MESNITIQKFWKNIKKSGTYKNKSDRNNKVEIKTPDERISYTV